jgi:flagellar motor protein MotB
MNAPYSIKKKVRPARPVQKKPAELAEDGHSWAVSYADFLMVLLSFFILFFSMDKTERVSFIENLLAKEDMAQVKSDGSSPPLGGDQKAGLSQETKTIPATLKSLTHQLKGFYIDQKNSDRITISFKDNIYRLGAFDLEHTDVQILHGLLKQLEPFMKSVNITFVGHTDQTTSFKGNNKYVGNNFDLSSLRATKALQQAVKLGFNPSHMYAQGVAEHQRASRTLSVILSPGGVTK